MRQTVFAVDHETAYVIATMKLQVSGYDVVSVALMVTVSASDLCAKVSNTALLLPFVILPVGYVVPVAKARFKPGGVSI